MDYIWSMRGAGVRSWSCECVELECGVVSALSVKLELYLHGAGVWSCDCGECDAGAVSEWSWNVELRLRILNCDIVGELAHGDADFGILQVMGSCTGVCVHRGFHGFITLN